MESEVGYDDVDVEATKAEALIARLKALGVSRSDSVATRQALTALEDEKIAGLLSEIDARMAGLDKAIGVSSEKKKLDAGKDDDFKKTKDGPDLEETMEAEKYLYWEPDSFKEKMLSLAHNTFEAWFVFVVLLGALFFSSIVAACFFALSLMLFTTMTLPQRRRFFFAKLLLGFYTLLVVALIIWKARKTDTMVPKTTDWKVFRYEIRFYESLGFELIYKEDDFKHKNADPDYTYEYQAHFVRSFMFEAFVVCMILTSIGYLQNQTKKINYLCSPDSREALDAYFAFLLKKHQEAEEEDDKEFAIGSKGVMTKEERALKEDQERQENEKMAELKKKVRKHFIDSDHFYNYNQVFFMATILLVLMQANIFNSCLDIPILFQILLLFSLYAYRKVYTVGFLRYTFFTIYYIQFMMALKLLKITLTKIEYVQEYVEDNQKATLVEVVDILFGGIESHDQSYKMFLRRIGHVCIIVICFIVAQCWKATKWIEIRVKTQHMEGQGWLTRFNEYLRTRDQSNQLQLKLVKKLDLKALSKKSKKDEKKKAKKKAKFDSGNAAAKARRDFSKRLPTLVLWTARALMLLLVYEYHTYVSLIHLAWILLSFLVSQRVIFMVSVYAMIPFLSWEFILIYGVRIPIVQDTTFFKTYGEYFQWEMKVRMEEQTLMFLTLATFYMMISCMRMTQKSSGQEDLIQFFRKRIADPRFSNGWKFLFMFLRYIQSVVLLFLFFNGISNLNNFKNLGFMVFFVVYTAYEEIYRQTSILLILFTSFYIFGQYFFSLTYQLVMDENNSLGDEVTNRYRWLNLYPPDNSATNPFNFEKGESFYFKMKPDFVDWVVLVLMSFLNAVNQMFKKKDEVNRLTKLASSSLSDQYSTAAYYYGRVEKIVTSLLIYAMIIFMIWALQTLETNLINWVFFVLNTLQFAFIVRGSKSLSYLRQSLCVANSIKAYSLFILILDILFICFIGEFEKKHLPHSIDQKFKAKFPLIYDNLDVIGLRANANLDSGGHALKAKFIAYVEFFLLAIYLSNHYRHQVRLIKADRDFTSEDYKRLFEFQMEKSKDEDHEDNEEANSGAFKKKNVYHYTDLIDFYERTRFTLPFMVYRAMNFWPLFDLVATYGHLLSNFIAVYVAINISVSFFMAFNILCVCCFYMIATHRLHQRAHLNFDRSGLQSQCDVKMAQIITKRYKSESYYEFLSIRRSLWNIQVTALFICTFIGFPTSILYQIREKQLVDPTANADVIKKIDNISFWVFMAGIYKDGRDGNEYFFAFTFIFLIIALVFERQCINWLKNRFGCTYFKLQKFIELDLRRDALRPRCNWEVPNPSYSIEHYRKHYFSNDFDDIKKKIEQNISENKSIKADEYGRKPIGDFVPHQVATRVRDTITFSVKLDCRASDLNIDPESKRLLQGSEDGSESKGTNAAENGLSRAVTKRRKKAKKFDYELVPVLARFKSQQLEKLLKQAVDMKYRISLSKGFQLVCEALIMLLLMASIVLKSNIYSIIYLVFIYKFVVTKSKTQLLVRINTYMSIMFFTQYILYVLNLSANTSPAPFPPGFTGYPKHEDPNDLSIEFSLPWFFHYEAFHNLRLAYLLGVGIDKD